jgi:hypothetical protein
VTNILFMNGYKNLIQGRGGGKSYSRYTLIDRKKRLFRCEVCNRKKGNPRKNKTFYDETRCVELETETITKTETIHLKPIDKEPFKRLTLILCQQYRMHIEINEIAYLKPLSNHVQGLRYRFNKKNEIITDEFISVTEPTSSSSFPEENYQIPHYKDEFENSFIIQNYMDNFMPKPSPHHSVYPKDFLLALSE